MDRNQAKEFYPILQAYAEGRVIECRTKPSALSKSWQDMNEWTEMKELEYWNNIEYRIKQQSEAKFRPFNTEEECWQEIRKHEPFIKYKVIESSKDVYLIIQRIKTDGIETDVERLDFETAFEWFTFADGVPFGVKVEEQLWHGYVQDLVAKKGLSMDSYKNEMNGIYSSSVCEETIDEAPMAYKSTEEIVELIKPTVNVIDVIKPIYNFKAKL